MLGQSLIIWSLIDILLRRLEANALYRSDYTADKIFVQTINPYNVILLTLEQS